VTYLGGATKRGVLYRAKTRAKDAWWIRLDILMLHALNVCLLRLSLNLEVDSFDHQKPITGSVTIFLSSYIACGRYSEPHTIYPS
jgi:hypothetical protein